MADPGVTVPSLGVSPSSGKWPSAGAMAVGGQMRGEDRYGPPAHLRANERPLPDAIRPQAEALPPPLHCENAGGVSPGGTPHPPDHAPRKFCGGFLKVWLSLQMEFV